MTSYWRTGAVFAAACALSAVASQPALCGVKVVATIKPIHSLVAGVMEGAGTPKLLVTGTASPHTFALQPSGARALHEADVFFRVSPSVEPFTIKIVRSMPGSVKVVTLMHAPGVSVLPLRSLADDAHGHHDDHHGHDHGHHDDHDHDKNDMDGHVWLDPENAKSIVAEIARVLGEAEPSQAAVFQANAKKLTAKIDALSANIASTLKPVAKQPYVVFHDAYQYFERRFGLSQVAAITVSPEVKPGAKRLLEIREAIRHAKPVCAFAEPQFKRSILNAVMEGSGARFGVLDPEAALVKPGVEAYETMLSNLASNMRECLSNGSNG